MTAPVWILALIMGVPYLVSFIAIGMALKARNDAEKAEAISRDGLMFASRAKEQSIAAEALARQAMTSAAISERAINEGVYGEIFAIKQAMGLPEKMNGQTPAG